MRRAKYLTTLGILCAFEGFVNICQPSFCRQPILAVLLVVMSVVLMAVSTSDRLLVSALRRGALEWTPKGSIYIDEEDEIG